MTSSFLSNQPAASQLYREYVFNGKSVATEFWGPIPHNIKDAITLSEPFQQKYCNHQMPIFNIDRVEQLADAITDIHRTHSFLTPEVKVNLELLLEQPKVIEAGHQPAVLGGPGFIVNKLATINRLAAFHDAVPLMFVGDHDHEQKELTVFHLPSPGPKGLTFSLPISKKFRQSPLHVLPLPPKSWLAQATQKIESTYHELITQANRPLRAIFTQRAKTILDLVNSTYTKASGVSDWTLRLWMGITSKSKTRGLLFQVFSHPTIRTLMLPAFEHLLNKKVRPKFIQTMNKAAENLQKLGYQPGVGVRPLTYIPFHIECLSKGCNRTRLDPVLSKQLNSSTIEITAHCPKCKETHSLEISTSHPDLSSWKDYLSPRVDTRSFLVQSFTPVILHIGGAGETNYYAQVLPTLAAIKSLVPIFFQYTRLFYGNPWTRNTGEQLQKLNFTPLTSKALWTFLSSVETAYREENPGVVRCLFAACGEHLKSSADQLQEAEAHLSEERNEAINAQREAKDPSTRRLIQNKVGQLTRQRHLIQLYLSQMFGRYAPERFGQEVSFAWIDMAMSLGPEQLFERLTNHYQLLTPSAATFYLPEKIDISCSTSRPINCKAT